MSANGFLNGSHWTMTPSIYDTGAYWNPKHIVGMYGGNANTTNNVRPVINLKADNLFTGKGTVQEPYEITMN